MGQRQTVTMEDRERAMGIHGMEQCSGSLEVGAP